MPSRPCSSSPRGERLFRAALLVMGPMALSAWLSGHALLSLIRVAWTPAIVAGALLLALVPVEWRRWLPWGLLTLLLLAAADTLYQALLGVDFFGLKPFGSRLSGFLPHPNDTALWAVLLPFTPLWLWPLSLGLIWMSASRTALAGALCVGILLTPRRWRLPLAGVLAGGFLLVLIYWVALGHGGQTSGTARVGMWLVALEMFRQAPWVGQGPARFVDFYLPTLAQLGPHPLGTEAEWAFVPWAHNLYLEVVAELGVIGLVAMALPLVWVWRRGDRQTRAALGAFGLMGLVDLTFLKPWVVGVYWGLCLLGLGSQASREARHG